MTSIPSWSPAVGPQAPQNGTAPSQQTGSTQPAAQPIPQPLDYRTDAYEQAPRRLSNYSAVTGAGGPVKQDTYEDCGEAAVATIVKQLGGKGAAQDPSQIMSQLKQQFARDHPGTTPEEMVQMLAHEGFAATRGSTNFDQGAADAALAKGGRVLVLADSHQLRPEGAESQQTSAAHWVVLDGKDAQGNYQVSDPLDGSRYTSDLAHLAKAMNASWISHQGGGMLVVQSAPGQSEQDLTAQGEGNTPVLGEKPGIGSNGIRLGQETNPG